MLLTTMLTIFISENDKMVKSDWLWSVFTPTDAHIQIVNSKKCDVCARGTTSGDSPKAKRNIELISYNFNSLVI